MLFLSVYIQIIWKYLLEGGWSPLIYPNKYFEGNTYIRRKDCFFFFSNPSRVKCCTSKGPFGLLKLDDEYGILTDLLACTWHFLILSQGEMGLHQKHDLFYGSLNDSDSNSAMCALKTECKQTCLCSLGLGCKPPIMPRTWRGEALAVFNFYYVQWMTK